MDFEEKYKSSKRFICRERKIYSLNASEFLWPQRIIVSIVYDIKTEINSRFER